MKINSTFIICVFGIRGFFYYFRTFSYFGSLHCNNNSKEKKTRMTTSIKAKPKTIDGQTNINKYRVAANITEYHIIPKLKSFFQKAINSSKNVKNSYA